MKQLAGPFLLVLLNVACSSAASPETDTNLVDTSLTDQSGGDQRADLESPDEGAQDGVGPDTTVDVPLGPDILEDQGQPETQDQVQPGCGDGICSEGETPCSCGIDCLGEGEIGQACCTVNDCLWPACGPCCLVECVDYKCVAPPAPVPCCWNGQCEEGETPESCPEDCQEPGCGDGICNGAEDPCTCGADCLGGNACCVDSDCPPLNCGPCCVLKCEQHECSEEPFWLEECCFNNKCEPGESSATCPADCSCGNGTCDAGEDVETCDVDCDLAANVDPACDGLDPMICGVASGRAMVVVDSGWQMGLAQGYQGVLVEAFRDGIVVASALTPSQGSYKLTLSPGTYTLRATPPAAEDEWDVVYPASIEQEISVIPEGNTVTDFEFVYSGMVVDKPNIYLYPEQATAVSVDLGLAPGCFLTVTIPEYGQGWDVLAQPDGTLDGKWGYLFYEAAVGGSWQTGEGHDVPADGLEAWMEQMLPAYGLNPQETQDFVEFWKEALPSSPWYTFYPQYDAAISTQVTLTVTPAPESLLRLWFLIVPSDIPALVPEPAISPFQRTGFSVVEWGVIVQ